MTSSVLSKDVSLKMALKKEMFLKKPTIMNDAKSTELQAFLVY